MVLGMLNKGGYMPKNKLLRGTAEISIMAILLTIGLPMSIAFFSQKGKIKAKYTEKEFRDR